MIAQTSDFRFQMSKPLFLQGKASRHVCRASSKPSFLNTKATQRLSKPSNPAKVGPGANSQSAASAPRIASSVPAMPQISSRIGYLHLTELVPNSSQAPKLLILVADTDRHLSFWPRHIPNPKSTRSISTNPQLSRRGKRRKLLASKMCDL